MLVIPFVVFCIHFTSQQEEVPFKLNNEFQVDLDYQFKTRPTPDRNTLNFDPHEERDRSSGSQLPYLIVSIKFLKLSDEEVRAKGVNNLGHQLFNRKVKPSDVVKIDMGFTDDVKDRVTPHEFTVFLLSSKKEVISRIKLLVEEDGIFLVNGEKRGKL